LQRTAILQGIYDMRQRHRKLGLKEIKDLLDQGLSLKEIEDRLTSAGH
jgi:hypothetical protein